VRPGRCWQIRRTGGQVGEREQILRQGVQVADLALGAADDERLLSYLVTKEQGRWARQCMADAGALASATLAGTPLGASIVTVTLPVLADSRPADVTAAPAGGPEAATKLALDSSPLMLRAGAAEVYPSALIASWAKLGRMAAGSQ
jgi:hypothetical protein